MKIQITDEDFIDANMKLIDAFIFQANSTEEKEKKIKNLVMAKQSIEKTLAMLGFSQT